MKYWMPWIVALLCASCVSTKCEVRKGEVCATSWVGFRINELTAYDQLSEEEKNELRSQFWLDLGRYKITCPQPVFLNRIHLPMRAGGGVSAADMESAVREAVKEVDKDLDVYPIKSQDYECVGGVPTCKRLYQLQAESRPFVTSHDSRAGTISATFDITLVIEL